MSILLHILCGGIVLLIAGWGPASAGAGRVGTAAEVSIESGAASSRNAALAETTPALALDDCTVPGSCWEVASILSVAVNLELAGKSKRCAKSCLGPYTQVYALHADTYQVDGGLTFGCPNGGSASIGDGTLRRKGKRIYLVPSDVDGVERTLRPCVGGVRPKLSSWVRLSSDLLALRGKTAARGRSSEVTPIGEGSTRIAVKLKHRGIPLGSPSPPDINTKLPPCPDVLTVRCELLVER